MKTEITKRIVKVFIDGKHRKSFPLFLENEVKLIPEDIIIKMDKSKILSNADCELCSEYIFNQLAQKFLLQLQKYEKYVFELTIGNTIIGTRKVCCKNEAGRHELIFDNNLKIKCPEYLHKFSTNKIKTVNSNY